MSETKYKILTEAVHPETGETYRIGDIVVIYQGRNGHNNIITISSMFTTTREVDRNTIYVSDEKYALQDFEITFPNNPKGTYLESIKRKLTLKEYTKIMKAKQLASEYNY